MADQIVGDFTVDTAPLASALFPNIKSPYGVGDERLTSLTDLRAALFASGVVTSITGTANQITASASTGAVTLSIPTSAVLVTPVFTTNITTPVIKSATTVAIQTNGTTQAVLFGTDQSATFAYRVGVNVAAPAAALHVIGASGESPSAIYEGIVNGGGIVVELRNKRTNGAATTSDAGPIIAASAWDGAAYRQQGYIAFYANGTISGSDSSSYIGLFTTPAGSVTSTEKLRISSAGKALFTPTANTTAIAVTGYSVTGSSTVPAFDIAGTLNNGSTVIDVFKIAITNTATGVASKALNIYGGAAGTTSVFSVGTNGDLTITGGGLTVTANSPIVGAGNFDMGGGIAFISRSTGKLTLYNGGQLGWISGASVLGGIGTVDFGINRNAANIGELNTGTPGTFADLKLRNLLVQAGGSIDLSIPANIILDTATGTKIGTATTQKLGFYNATPVVQQTDGAALTNSVVASGTTDTLTDFVSLTIYATDAQAIHDDIYQLGRKVKIIGDALRTYGLLS